MYGGVYIFLSVQMDNLDPNLKRLFDDAGVSAQELQDEDTAQFIYDFIESSGGIDAVTQQSQKPRASRPAMPTIPQPPIPSSGQCILYLVE